MTTKQPRGMVSLRSKSPETSGSTASAPAQGRSPRRGLRRGAAIACVALVAVACASTAPSKPAAAAKVPAFTFYETPLAGGFLGYNPFSPSFVWPALDGPVFMGLTLVPSAPATRFGTYIPELATSWSATRSAITLHLRKGAKWQNGDAVTSRDVVTSLLLQGESLAPEWEWVSGVRTPNALTVVLRLRPGAIPALVLQSVMTGGSIVPASQYASLAPAVTEAEIIHYWDIVDPGHASPATEKAASASTYGTALAKLDAALTKFEPASMIGDGPFRLVKYSGTTVVLDKWGGFWDASAIHVPSIDIEALSSTTMTGDLLTGGLDWESVSPLSGAPLGAAIKTPGLHMADYVGSLTPGLNFSVKIYPMGITAVRQTIAYLIDRPNLVALMSSGGPTLFNPVTAPDGLPNALTQRYLAKSQLARLNPYSYSPAKAQELLLGAGFTKRGGAWYNPNGTRFTLALSEPASTSPFDVEALVIQAALNNFGIATSVNAVSPAVFYTDDAAGDYAVALDWETYGSPDPISFFDASFSASTSYPEAGWPAQVAVPGIGIVNPTSATAAELPSAAPSLWPRVASAWARYVNKNLPYLNLYSFDTPIVYSSRDYTDWPRPSSPYWKIGTNHGALLVYLMMHGFVRPKA